MVELSEIKSVELAVVFYEVELLSVVFLLVEFDDELLSVKFCDVNGS